MTNWRMRGAGIWRVGKQLIREFWIPLIAALLWTWYRYHVSTEGDVISTVIAAFAGSFFLASWATGQFVRVNRQQIMEDALQALVQGVKDVNTSMATMLDAAEQLQQHTKDVPGLNLAVQKLVASIQTANTQVAAANNAISAARNNLPITGWISDWPPVAVGTRVTSRPPHRSVRAAFPNGEAGRAIPASLG